MKRLLVLFLLVTVFLLPSLATGAAATADPATSAKADFLLNVTTGEVYYGKNADVKRVPASLTKLMTVYMVYDAIASGSIAKDTSVGISSHTQSIATDPEGSNVPLYCGTFYTVDELLSAAMLVSANGAACALGELLAGNESAFAQKMTARAQALGWDMTFYDAAGLDDRNCVTAGSIAALASALITQYPDVLNYSARSGFNFRGKHYRSTNKLLPGNDYAYAGTDGLKTGTTDAAGMCLIATCVRGGNRLLAVVLGAGSTAVRYGDAIKMFNYGFTRTISLSLSNLKYHLNGDSTELTSYTISNQTYVRLRDLAALLANTNKKFSAAWDTPTSTVMITTGQSEQNDTMLQETPATLGAKVSNDRINVDGSSVNISGYAVNKDHYYSLQELSAAIGLHLSYDSAANTLYMVTGIDYTQENSALEVISETIPNVA